MADYRSARGQDPGPYLVSIGPKIFISQAQLDQDSANKIYDIVSGQWDDTVCGGGGTHIATPPHLLP